MDDLSVCFLMHRKFPSNFSTAFNSYIEILSNEGVDVTVISATDRRKKNIYGGNTYNGVSVFKIPSKIGSARSIYPSLFFVKSVGLIHRLNRKSWQRDFDILHMIGFPNLGLGLYPPPVEGMPPVKILDIRGTAVSSWWADRLSRIVLRFQNKVFKNTIVLSETVKESILGEGAKCKVVPLGANFKKFKPGHENRLRKSIGITNSDTTMIYVGNLHPSRNLKEMIKSFHILLKRYDNIKLVIVGGGEEYSMLEEYTNKLGISDSVIMTGPVEFEEVPKYLRLADIGISYIPKINQYKDQPPIKTVEYMASGLPVVATKTPGNRLFIDEEVNGVLAEDEPDEFANAVQRLMENNELMARVKKNARESVLEYDYRTIVLNELLPFYRKCKFDNKKANED